MVSTVTIISIFGVSYFLIVCTPPLWNIWTYRNTRMYQGYCDTIVDANVILTQIYGYGML